MLPSDEYELTANSLGAHMKVTESSPGMGHFEDIYLAHSVLTRWNHSELVVSFPWLCNSRELAVSSWWDHPDELTVWVACELILWVHCKLNERSQNELAMSLMWVYCELAVSSNSSQGWVSDRKVNSSPVTRTSHFLEHRLTRCHVHRASHGRIQRWWGGLRWASQTGSDPRSAVPCPCRSWWSRGSTCQTSPQRDLR